MTCKVRLFARARELAGTESVFMELPDGATVAELRRKLAEEHPHLANLAARSAFAVDDEFAEETTKLTPDDEIALLPPVSGGSLDQ